MLNANGYPTYIIYRNRSIVSKQPTTKIEPSNTIHTVRLELKVHTEDAIIPLLKNGVVYQMQCGLCNDTYVGQTGRRLEHTYMD